MKPIIYSMTFASGAFYIGYTKNFGLRRRTHRRELRRGRGINTLVRAEYAAHGMPTFQEVATLKFGEPHKLEALVIKSLRPTLNVAEPSPVPATPSASSTRAFGPYASIRDFASAVGVSYTHAKRLSGQYSYEACLYKLAYRAPKRVRPISPMWAIALKLAEETGKSPAVCCGLISNYGSYEAALTATRKPKKMPTPAKYLTHNGVRKKLNDWAKENGVPQSRLYFRIHAGWPPEQAAGLAPRSYERNTPPAPTHDCEDLGRLTLKQMAAQAGISPAGITARMKAGSSPREACDKRQ